MAVAVSDILGRAAIILNDVGATRWTAPEMLKWVNDGQREIVIHKPSANTETRSIPLAAGTRQNVPTDALQIVRVLRNTGGAAITMVDREIMNIHVPGWGDEAVWPPSDTVEHAIYDHSTPEIFDVFPSNTGGGQIDVALSVLPADIPDPVDPTSFDSYTATIEIPDSYRTALVDYVLYRAFSKDAEYPDAAQRAAAYFQTFSLAIGVKTRGELRDNPDATMGP